MMINKKWTIGFLLIRIIMYVIISLSFVPHGISVWLLFVLFIVIEVNVWIMDIFIDDSDSKRLLDKFLKRFKK